MCLWLWGEIIWKDYMKYRGVPKYLSGHYLKDKTHEEIYGVEGNKDKDRKDK